MANVRNIWTKASQTTSDLVCKIRSKICCCASRPVIRAPLYWLISQDVKLAPIGKRAFVTIEIKTKDVVILKVSNYKLKGSPGFYLWDTKSFCLCWQETSTATHEVLTDVKVIFSELSTLSRLFSIKNIQRSSWLRKYLK